MTVSKRIARIIEDSPNASFFVYREPRNYEHFLDLYETVGYGHSGPGELSAWRRRSRATWEKLDNILPGSCTGGWWNREIVSSAGTLPQSERLLWIHSYCMKKTPEAAATLYAQALHSLSVMESSSFEYFVGSYDARSRFTGLFQRPVAGVIPGQLEVKALRCSPANRVLTLTRKRYKVDPISAAKALSIPLLRSEILELLIDIHPSISSLVSSQVFAVIDGESDEVDAVLFVQDTPAELTAFNVYSQVWVFPSDKTAKVQELEDGLRAHSRFAERVLLFLETPSDAYRAGAATIFWRFTPRSSLPELRRAIQTAFWGLFEKIPSLEGERLIKELDEGSSPEKCSFL